MDKKEEKKQNILAFVIVILVIILGIYKIFFDKSNIEEEKIDTETISVLNNRNKFFIVSSCVSNYINYLSISDTKNLLILISEDYKNKNSINETNIYNYIGTLQVNNSFTPKKMYVQRISKNVYKYYVYGYIQEENENFFSNKVPFYLIVILNEEDMTYAIEPYNGSMFK